MVYESERHNWALNKACKQSTTIKGAVAARAVDGNTSNIFSDNSCTLTSPNEKNGWWDLTLAQIITVDEVYIVAPGDKGGMLMIV